MWVDESEAYLCETCNALFYVTVVRPSSYNSVVHCVMCGDENVISKDNEGMYSNEDFVDDSMD